jgi:tetratricopeptide (TPR) repeat protein
MNIPKLVARAFPLLFCSLLLASPVRAQMTMVEGQVLSIEGKPFPDVTVQIKSTEMGQQLEAKTDRNGKWLINGVRSGLWNLTLKVKDQVIHERQIRIALSGNEPIVINFKDLIAKESAEESAKRKKFEEDQQKFVGMKAHFDAGRAAIDQAIAVRNEIQKTPVADRGPLNEKLAQFAGAAVTELEAAEKTAPEKDPNLHIVLGNLGLAYDLVGRNDEAAAAYAKAVELKPDSPNNYLALGTVQAKAGKVTEAMETCDKVAKLTATAADAVQVASSCFGNVGIVLQNGSKMKESVEPLKRATQIKPDVADYWFLLGRALSNAMESKTEGGKIIAVVPPGTAEAFQKYLELAPNGRFAQEAKDGLETLRILGVGIESKVSTKKSKKP